MRHGTFFAPLTALFLLGAGCTSLPTDTEGPPTPDTPLGLLETFEWCYDHQDEALYAEILDPDFTCYPDPEEVGEPEDYSWGYDEELARFAELCDACGGEMDLVLDLSNYEEPGPDDEVWPIPDVEYTLYAIIGDTTYLVPGTADFLAVKAADGRWRLLELRGFERPELP
jgi:hypothetical protein